MTDLDSCFKSLSEITWFSLGSMLEDDTNLSNSVPFWMPFEIEVIIELI